MALSPGVLKRAQHLSVRLAETQLCSGNSHRRAIDIGAKNLAQLPRLQSE